ncbi:divalent-cation tolerance protein CutA [Caenispirillum salinarum]|nr:divalent-cation tolerance protein CutA [Caenispirillum salinarum]
MSRPVLIYMTAGSTEEAKKVGRVLVEERLAACVNILGGMTSLYWWDDAVQEDDEVAFIAKTRQGMVDDVIARVKEVHSYDCPCVVSISIDDGNADFLQWIQEMTSQFPGHSSTGR